LFFASKPYIIAAGILPMAYGDASAAMVGQKYGKTKYNFFTKKSVEGSVAMFLVSFLSVEASLFFFSCFYSLPFAPLTFATLAIALVVTVVEALSPKGFDNLAVPLLGALMFLLISGGI
ncbi:MAG TPA: phosphatidate cytidylyltransferase, partial [Candidatus Bathyarchaeia archaeon]